jgi:16S rRNA C1402 (ribose-2'-O) methylase RsmI
MNGQSFFGYLPIEKTTLRKNHLRKPISNFFETPYRNNKLLEDFKTCILKRICIATDITFTYRIHHQKIAAWKKRPSICINALQFYHS